MTVETKPTADQIRFLSSTTGEQVLDAYIEACEKGGRPLYEILDGIFDSYGNIRGDIIEFRENPAIPGKIQSRIGDFVDPNDGWVDIPGDTFPDLTDDIAQVNAAKTATLAAAAAAATSATASETSNGLALARSNLAASWAGKLTGAVSTGPSLFSAKEYAIGTWSRGVAQGTTNTGGSAKDWATYTGGTVNDVEYSAKQYALNAAANVGAVRISVADTTPANLSSKITPVNTGRITKVITNPGANEILSLDVGTDIPRLSASNLFSNMNQIINGRDSAADQSVLRVRYTSSNDSYSTNLSFQHLQLGNNGLCQLVAGATAAGGQFEFWVNNTNLLANTVVTPNGTKAMTISPAGYVNMPTQPRFSAYRDAGNYSANTAPFVFNGEYYDVGSNYNTSNGRFTAPIAGTYCFDVMLQVQPAGSTQVQCYLRVNGVDYKYVQTSISGVQGMFLHENITLQASDYVDVRINYITGTATFYGGGPDYTTFAGYLIA